MFISDMPNMPPDVPVMYAPVVIAQATQAKDATKLDRTIGVCQLINSLTGDIGRDPQSLIYVIVPVLTVSDYINRFEKRFVGLEGKATLLQGAAHGTVKDEGDQYYRYVPNLNYLGSDRATFLVEIGGLKVKVVYHLKVINGGAIGGTEADDKQNCPKGMFWKISSTLAPNGNLIVTSVEYQSPTLSDMAATLGASLFGDTSDITLNIADLPSGAVGQTVGNTITLDTTAAGYNWFIDSTPGDNSEYLPTADANIWQARAGSEAVGKMDMLSVLLHEYGHVLGIEHSADQHASMATTLTPGTRRLPSAGEMALMAQLVGEVKVGMNADLPAAPDSPLLPNAPLAPLGGFGLAFLGRMRKSSYGGSSIDVVGMPTITQYVVAANATRNRCAVEIFADPATTSYGGYQSRDARSVIRGETSGSDSIDLARPNNIFNEFLIPSPLSQTPHRLPPRQTNNYFPRPVRLYLV